MAPAVELRAWEKRARTGTRVGVLKRSLRRLGSAVGLNAMDSGKVGDGLGVRPGDVSRGLYLWVRKGKWILGVRTLDLRWRRIMRLRMSRRS